MLLEGSKQEGYKDVTPDKQLQFMVTQDKLLQHHTGPTYICNYIQVFVKPVRN